MASKDNQAAEVAETPPMGLTRPSVRKWQRERPGQGCGPQTRNSELEAQFPHGGSLREFL